MKNWKTSLFGTLTSIFAAIAAVETPYKEYCIAAAAICGALFALFSKDNNVSGTQSDEFKNEIDEKIQSIGTPTPPKRN